MQLGFNVSNLGEGTKNQHLEVRNSPGRTLIDHSVGGGNIYLKGGTSVVLGPLDSIVLEFRGDGNWYEVSRSIL
jgi:hypothetical protein